MKRLLLISTILLSVTFMGAAQIIDDAVRYSQVFQTGTARFNSMGGAFSALGGDPSSMHQNPAGLGVYRSSELSFTPIVYNVKSNAAFKGNLNTDYFSDFDISQLGVVISSNKNRTNGLVSFNFGYSYNKTNILGYHAAMNGISNRGSMADSWADNANGYYHDELGGAAFLAYETWLIDTLSGYNDRYGTAFSNFGDGTEQYGQTMRRGIETEGYTAEHAFSLAANISNKLYIGTTLGIAVIDYYEQYSHMEKANESLESGLTSFTYNTSFSSSATGINFKIGAIYKPIESLRLSLAIHTPTLYWLEDIYSDNMSTTFVDNRYSKSNSANLYKYKLRTPGRAILGAAYQFGNFGMISFDYELVDYSKSRFQMFYDEFSYANSEDYYADVDYFDNLNGRMSEGFKLANNVRVGAEFRVSKIYFRAGYAYYDSPWKDSDYLNYGKGYNSVSGGLGLRLNTFYMDFGYSAMFNNQTYMLYSSSTGSPLADIDFTKNVFSLSLGFKF